jgi:hypothetical protein
MPPDGYRFFKFRWTYGCKNKCGYLVVKYRGKTYKVHRLIAQTFLDNPLNLPTVDHISRDKLDNRLENLRFASRKLQQDNRQVCEDSLARYGVRECEDKRAYKRALYANNPEFAERERARAREYRAQQRASNPEYVERERARGREKYAKQKALGKHTRRCPDGKQRFLTDSEFAARFGNNPQQTQLF